MGLKLDRSRHYGETFPFSLYLQDHKFFDRNGDEVPPPPADPVPDPAQLKAEEESASEARLIDLRKKENAALRPSAKAKPAQ